MTTPVLIAIYLAVLVAANLVVYTTGQVALLLTGLVLVPLDFSIRVRLQEAWSGPGLWLRLAVLMVAGGGLTILVLPDASQVALASVSAFAAGSLLGAVVYAAALRWRTTVARGCSLGAMAAIDSVVFPMLAFEQVSGWLMVGQFLMKWLASGVFLVILNRVNRRAS
jgi:hypothetical protein